MCQRAGASRGSRLTDAPESRSGPGSSEYVLLDRTPGARLFESGCRCRGATGAVAGDAAAEGPTARTHSLAARWRRQWIVRRSDCSRIRVAGRSRGGWGAVKRAPFSDSRRISSRSASRCMRRARARCRCGARRARPRAFRVAAVGAVHPRGLWSRSRKRQEGGVACRFWITRRPRALGGRPASRACCPPGPRSTSFGPPRRARRRSARASRAPSAPRPPRRRGGRRLRRAGRDVARPAVAEAVEVLAPALAPAEVEARLREACRRFAAGNHLERQGGRPAVFRSPPATGRDRRSGRRRR